jgi:hypothetical protein
MLEECGDFWTVPADLRCITTNGALRRNGNAIMGKGIALEARRRYHAVEAILGSYINRYGNHVFSLGYDLISFPTKYHWKQDSDIQLIKRSAQELVMLLKDSPAKRVLLTRPGCGNGNLKWPDVNVVIQDILADNKFVVVYKDYSGYQQDVYAGWDSGVNKKDISIIRTSNKDVVRHLYR